MGRILILVTLLTIHFGLLGCKKADPKPELKDQVFLDILNRIKSTEAEIKTQTDALTKLKDERTKIPIHEFLLLKGNQKETAKTVRTLTALDQQLTYLRIRHNQRLAFVRKHAHEAFESETEFDSTEEWQTIQKARRLQGIQRDWDARVPKSTRYNRSVASVEAKPKKKAEKASEHH